MAGMPTEKTKAASMNTYIMPPDEELDESDNTELKEEPFTRGTFLFPYWILGFLALAGFVLYLLLRDFEVQGFLLTLRDLGPLPFFIALTFLPAVGFPTTPFFLLAGAAFGVQFSIIASGISQAVNLVFAYWLAKRFLRDWIEYGIRKTKYRIPVVKPENYLKVSILIKIAPGPPNFVKSYLLGLAGIPFKIFFLVSWPATMAYAVGLIVLGDSLFDGDTGRALVAAVVLVAVVITMKLIYKHYARKKAMNEEEEG